MGEMSGYAAGEFCWIELATNDLEAATAYYTTLFGWTIEDQPAGDAGFYRTCRVDGKKVLGLFEMDDEEQALELPHWNSYVSVADVDESAKSAESLGGSVAMPPFDVMDQGRMAVVQDPSGARLGLWQAGESFGAELTNDPGSLTWMELGTKDSEAARSFYGELFGWESETQDMGGTTYTSFKSGEGYTGGCVEMPAGEDVWPSWLVYLETDDVDSLVAKSDEMGGYITVPPQDAAEVGRFAILQDPQGAGFGVLKSAPTA